MSAYTAEAIPAGRTRLAPPDAERVLLWALMAFVFLLSVVPMTRLLLEGLAPGGVPDPDRVWRILSSRSTWRATMGSLETSLVGTAIAMVLGGGFAVLIGLTDIRAKPFLVWCFLLPMMIPPQVTALAWAQLFGPSSALLNAISLAPPSGTPNPMYSREGIMLLLGVQHAPLVFLALRAGLRSMPRELIEAARASGAGTTRALTTIVLPLMTPSLIAGGALAFVSAIGNFGIPALLGIPANYTVLPTLIYMRLSSFGPGVIADVAVLSILVGLIAFSGVVLQAVMLRRKDYRLRGTSARPLFFSLGRWRLSAELASWAVIALILVAPLAALIATSLVPAYGVALTADTVTLENYREALLRQDATPRAFLNSFYLAGGAALTLLIVACPLAYFLVWRRGRLLRALDMAAELPYALPGVVLAIACILIFLKPIPVLGVSIYGTAWIIFVAYLARFLTLALRPVTGAFHQLDPRLEEAARMCGAGFIVRFRTILLPLVAPSAAAGAILVFLTAFNELTVSALLWASGSETVGVIVFNLDDGGSTTLASSVAVVTVIVIAALMGLLEALGRKLPSGVLPWRD